jgi:hypothetical protein
LTPSTAMSGRESILVCLSDRNGDQDGDDGDEMDNIFEVTDTSGSQTVLVGHSSDFYESRLVTADSLRS